MAIQPAGHGLQVMGVYSFFLALTTVTIILRTYCRVFVLKNFALDDWLAITAWVFFVIYSAFAITGTHHGTGQHVWEIHPSTEIPIGLKWWWACEPVYVLSNMAIKASIAVMLLRLTVNATHRIIIWAVLVVTELYATFFFLLFILQCRPSSYFWTRYTGGSGTCINPTVTVNAAYAYSAVTCVGDWVYAILPFFIVWKLQMNARSKMLVALILAMGAIASTATIIRIPYVHTLSDQTDFLYATTDVAIWSCVETGLGIAAACCATLRPLFRSFLAHTQFFSEARRQTGALSASHYPGIVGGNHGKEGHGGYIRSSSKAGTEELGLRDRDGRE